MTQRGSRHGPGVLVALREELLYSPVTWLAVLFVVEQLLVTHGLPGASTAGFLLKRWFGIVVMIVVLRPLLVPALGMLLYTFFFIGKRAETPERLRRRLLTKIRAQQNPAKEMTAIARIAEEGNVDPEHLDASLALWAGARYQHDARLEAEARRQVMELLVVDARQWQGRWLLPLYRAWLIRAEALLRANPRTMNCVPPPLPVGMAR